MSVQEQINRINQNVTNTYSALSALGADMPEAQNSDNLAATAADIKAVLYIAQTLTDAQKAQARANIGAADAVAADTVTADGTIAVSGAAVAAYVDLKLAQLGIYVRIVEQPVDVTAGATGNATFSVTATGEGLTYQWQVLASGAAEWVDTTAVGNKTSTVSITADMTQNGHMYRCIVMDMFGNKNISDVATLTVVPILITKQPENVIAAVGETAVFSIAAQGYGLTYQWEFSHNNGIDWGNVPRDTATTPELVMSNVGDYHNGYIFRCIITDANGNTVTTEGATLTVTSE